MSSIRLSTMIQAGRDRVWRALCDPSEVVQWDSSVMQGLDIPSDYPRPGQQVSWRCRRGIFRLLHDRPLEVVTSTRLRSALSLGFVHYDETYSLEGNENQTTLRADVQVYVALPLVGSLIDRLRAREDARQSFEASLAALKRHCEEKP